MKSPTGKRDDRLKLAEALARCRLHGATLVIAKIDRPSRDAHFLLALQKAGVTMVLRGSEEVDEKKKSAARACACANPYIHRSSRLRLLLRPSSCAVSTILERQEGQMDWLITKFREIFTFKRFVFYGFPVYLVIVEISIRFMLSFAPGKQEEVSIVAASSSISAAGLGLVAAALVPKRVEEYLVKEKDESKARTLKETITVAQKEGLIIKSQKDERIVASAYVGLLLLPLLWGLSLWMAHQEAATCVSGATASCPPGAPKPYHFHVFWPVDAPIPFAFLIALAIYVIGMVYTELKEAA